MYYSNRNYPSGVLRLTMRGVDQENPSFMVGRGFGTHSLSCASTSQILVPTLSYANHQNGHRTCAPLQSHITPRVCVTRSRLEEQDADIAIVERSRI